MGTHHDQPADIDPQALRDSRQIWHHFTQAMTFGVISIIAVLILMAVFLV